MVIREKQIYHFYDMSNGEWETPGGLEDLALLSVVFAEAAKRYRKPHYLHALKNYINWHGRKIIIGILEYFLIIISTLKTISNFISK